MRIEAKAGLRLLENGILGLRLKYDAENVPVLLLSGKNGEIRLDLENIYIQAFTARLDGKA